MKTIRNHFSVLAAAHWLRVVAFGTSLWMAAWNLVGAEFQTVGKFGSNPGKLLMYKYVPQQSDTPRPLVVVLHGCTQDHLYARDAGWDKLADKCNFILLVPEQTEANSPFKAFTWWEFKSTFLVSSPRTKKEVQSIQQMIDKMKADYKIDSAKVYITGLSAGGAMTSVMVAFHPDEFAGAGICSGLPHRSATTMLGAFTAMYCGTTPEPTAAQWGQRVRAEAKCKGQYPKISIWHGGADTTVTPKNEKQLMQQWTDVHGVDQIADEHADTPLGPNTLTHDVYKDNQGIALVETYQISGMPHATAIDPGANEDQGGVPSQYVKDEDIFSSYHMARFWGLIPPGPGRTLELSGTEKLNAVLQVFQGEAPAKVADKLHTSPAVTVELLESWKQKVLDAGKAALAQ